MTQNIQNNNNKSHLPQIALGVAGGAGAGFIFRKGVNQLKNPYLKLFFENADKFTHQEQDALIQEANRMVEESGIKRKGFNGINWINANKVNAEEAVKEIKNGIFETLKQGSFNNKLKIIFPLFTSPFKKLSEVLTGTFTFNNPKKMIQGVTLGCFDAISNKIYTAKPLSVMHEIGHAINRNGNFLTKMPKRLAMIARGMLIPLAILTAIFTKKTESSENKQETNKSSFAKLKEFVHKHIGLTVAGLSIPLLIEEGLASASAIKFANASKVLSETAKNQHNKVLKIAYGSYLIGTATVASAVSLAVFVKDKIIKSTTKQNN